MRRLTTWRAGTRRCLVRPVEVSYINSRGDRVQFSLSGERNANVHFDDVASDLQTTHRAYYGDCACYSPWWALPK